jgi:phosphoglucosamine mutase
MKLFGTDGIRGNSSMFPFDDRTLVIIGRSIAETLGNESAILIIRDTRESGERIQKKLANGIASVGMKFVFGGIMPTPSASLIVQKCRYSTAIVISASHNPYTDNGIKIFNSKGFKISTSVEIKIEKKINKYLNLKIKIPDKEVIAKENSSFLELYEEFIIRNFTAKNLNGKTIVVDCANGASYSSVPYVLKKLGAKILTLNVKPNGKNINLNCGALYPEEIAKVVKESKAFCGFAFDGDADRLVCIDENGVIRDGDYFLASMALWLKYKKKLKNSILVTTVMANAGLFQAMKEKKIQVVVSTKIGDRYVMNNMKKHKAVFGGEQSGHFIFKDFLTTGDGMLSAVMLLSALCDTNQTMSEFMDVIEKYPQVFVNRKIIKKVPVEKLLKSYNLIKYYESSLNEDGRVLVRYSDTENFLRVMVEGKDLNQIKIMAESIANTVEEEIEIYLKKMAGEI